MLKIIKAFYDKKYKWLLVIPILILLLSLGVLTAEKTRTGEFIAKDVSLKGGTLVTLETKEFVDTNSVENKLSEGLGASTNVKEIRGAGTGGRIGYIFELGLIGESSKIKSAIESATGIKLIEGQYTFEEMSSSLSSTFWSSTIRAILLAFAFMATVVFLYFRKIIPSIAIILAAVSNLIVVLATMNLLGIELSTAGVAALLMLLGYSVDTDILLSTRMLKRRDLTEDQRLYGALQTGMTMTLTTLVAMLVVWILTPSEVLKQITFILIIGLVADLPNTWIQNTGLLRWYGEKHKI